MLPDIGVLGRYTYLATELMWGVVAAGLLHYSGAWRAALRTALVLYPFALAWDWYTLEVGVFEIPLRTGIELLGVPLEEHIFMFLVPAMVVGTHESLRKLDATGAHPDPGREPEGPREPGTERRGEPEPGPEPEPEPEPEPGSRGPSDERGSRSLPDADR